MGLDPENPREWFTAGEVAQLARANGIAEVPHTESGMIKWIKRLCREGFESDVAVLSRRRAGRKGGGGTEYHWTLFSGYYTREIAKVLDREARRLRGSYLDEVAAVTDNLISDALFEAEPHQPGKIMFSPADFRYMTRLLKPSSQSGSWWVGFTRKVRRAQVCIRYRHYLARELSEFEGQWVALACWGGDGNLSAFVWRFDDRRRELKYHGERGLICMIEPPPEPEAYGALPLSLEEEYLKRILSRS